MDWFCALGVAPSFQRGRHKVCQQLHCLRLLHQSGLEGGFGGTCGICFAFRDRLLRWLICRFCICLLLASPEEADDGTGQGTPCAGWRGDMLRHIWTPFPCKPACHHGEALCDRTFQGGAKGRLEGTAHCVLEATAAIVRVRP